MSDSPDSQTADRMLLSLLVSLLATPAVLPMPRLKSGQQKAGHLFDFSRLYNMNYLPAEELVGDWNNPWSFSPTFPRVVPPSSDIMANFGLVPSYPREDGQDEDEDQSKLVHKRARDFTKKFRLYRHPLTRFSPEDGREGNTFYMKRNSVPMMG